MTPEVSKIEKYENRNSIQSRIGQCKTQKWTRYRQDLIDRHKLVARIISIAGHVARKAMVEVSPSIKESVETAPSATKPGQYFVSNYPPFAEWNEHHVPIFLDKLGHKPLAKSPLGLYFHIPFCRKRCNFCYFKVYADKSQREVDTYLNNLILELKIYADTDYVRSRPVDFIYIGGGTPSYLSVEHLRHYANKQILFFPGMNLEKLALRQSLEH